MTGFVRFLQSRIQPPMDGIGAKPASRFVFFFVLGIFAFGNLVRADKQSQGSVPPTEWHAVSLPFRPVCISSNGSIFWAGGVDEMLAKSEDGGLTWRVKHQQTNGEVLLAVGILGENVVYASGTNGEILRSDNGGETWKS